uniref:Claudin n=1 Tax=Mastacembelus armatus TaxID=205130 RepID=A0A3Q3M841_9TELE
MNKRLIQILGFLLSTLGWVFVLCTIAMDYWRITQYGGQGGSFVITNLWYWSNLWKDCSTDTTAVDDCREFPALWTVTSLIHAVRGLIMCGIGLGFIAIVLCFLGMECTYIGGAKKTKDKQLFAGALLHFAGEMFCSHYFLVSTKPLLTGVSDISAYGIYSNSITRIAFAPTAGIGVLRYDVGPPIFLGFVGSSFILLGAVLYAVTVFRAICPQRYLNYLSFFLSFTKVILLH